MSYSDLLHHYREILSLVDCIHFNSSVAQELYNSHLCGAEGELISITHSDIRDCRQTRNFDDEILHLIFIGNTTPYKGFPLLESTLRELLDEGFASWDLSVWGGGAESRCEKIKFRGSFTSDELSDVFREDGLLVLPSIWSETFGFTVLEAISYGIPTLVSSSVGAKDVVGEYSPWFIFEGKESLKSHLRELVTSHQRLREFNHSIVNHSWRFSISQHSFDMLSLYEKILTSSRHATSPEIEPPHISSPQG